jgi:aspartate beta-hydroxylase
LVTVFLLVEDLEADGLAGEPQPEVEDFLTVTDSDDRFEDLEPGTVHEGRTHLF